MDRVTYIGLFAEDELHLDTSGRKEVFVQEDAYRYPLPHVPRPNRPCQPKYNWGYPGTAPSDLAFALLAHAFDSPSYASNCYQKFKDDIIRCLPQDQPFAITRQEIFAWVLEQIQ